MSPPADGAATREIPPEVAELASEWGIAPPEDKVAPAADAAEAAAGSAADGGAPAAAQTADAPSAVPAAGVPSSAQEAAEELAAEEWQKRVKLHEDAAARATQEAAQLRSENERLRRTYQEWYAANQQHQAPAPRAPSQDDFVRLAAQDPQQALMLLAQQQAQYSQFMQQQAAAQERVRAEQAVASINSEIATYQAQGYKLANATEAFHAHVYRGMPLLEAVKQSHFATYKLLAAGRGAPLAVGGAAPAPKRPQPQGVGRVMGARGTPRGTAPQTAAEKHDLKNKSFDEATEIWMQETGQA